MVNFVAHATHERSGDIFDRAALAARKVVIDKANVNEEAFNFSEDSFLQASAVIDDDAANWPDGF